MQLYIVWVLTPDRYREVLPVLNRRRGHETRKAVVIGGKTWRPGSLIVEGYDVTEDDAEMVTVKVLFHLPSPRGLYWFGYDK